MQVIFFESVKKAVNSTAIPSGKPLTFDNCYLKERTSVISPEIMLTSETDMHTYNYCYIAQFGRYYFVNDWVIDGGVWCAVCAVDVMASYKSIIGQSERLVLRASYRSNPLLADGRYPSQHKTSYTVTSANIWKSEIEEGCYIVQTLSTRGSGYGAAKLWGFTPEQFSTLVDTLFGASSLDIDDFVVNSALVNKLLNPGQYITSCRWFPFSLDDIAGKTLQEALFIGKSALPGVPCYSIGADSWETIKVLKLSDKHPQTARGEFVNHAPYTKYILFVPPFGEIPVSIVGEIGDAMGIALSLSVDLFSGNCILHVIFPDGTNVKMSQTVGVDIPLAQLNTRYLEKISNVLFQSFNAVTGGGVSAGVGAVKSALECAENIRPIGSIGGGLNAYAQSASLSAIFTELAPEDLAHNGRPLFESCKPADIPGFIQCGEGWTNIPATMAEAERVNQFMRGGFYFE